MDGSDQGRTGASDTQETRWARTGSVKNQSWSLQRETQCCADERMEDVGAKPPNSAEASAQFRLVQTAARPCGNPFSGRCRVVGTDGAEVGGCVCGEQQQEQPWPRWHLDSGLGALESPQHGRCLASSAGRLSRSQQPANRDAGWTGSIAAASDTSKRPANCFGR